MEPRGPVGSSHSVFCSRAWYGATIGEFLETSPDTVYKHLASTPEFALLPTQMGAWLEQIGFLHEKLQGMSGSLLLEFNIPRMGRRIDAVIITGPVVFVVEFKVGESSFDRAAIDQVWDYALDLKNFHEASHSVSIIPILVATGASDSKPVEMHADADKVFRPLLVHPDAFRAALDSAREAGGSMVDQHRWTKASYRPTPTIIDAARALYAQHSVEAIARHDAGAQNLHATSRRVEELVDEAKAQSKKIICFVTGVPGAGKTLVGLNIATRRAEKAQLTHSVFLSGNGPLVAVLREALTRDEYARRKARAEKVTKKKIANPVKAFIQNVHHFRDEALIDSGPPDDHVVVFDEAQRAWNQHQASSFMRRKRNRPDFNHSEPEFLISYMDRHKDWAVIVCLVGGGQEIHTGEAGIGAWLDALNTSMFAHWHMYISARLTDSEYEAGHALESVSNRSNAFHDDSLHLAVSMRSFRAENVSTFVKALLDCERDQATAAFAKLKQRYPIAVTRNLNSAKDWIRKHARGSERYGLVASSKAMRLKPHAIDIRVAVDPVHYFLNERDDVRSSYYLEDAATEFQVQGLELDWACVTWDGDFRFTGSGWSHHDFHGCNWKNIQKAGIKAYLKNAYRVLLTRARQGMVVFVPPGDANDSTRLPTYYDSTFNYLASLGIRSLD